MEPPRKGKWVKAQKRGCTFREETGVKKKKVSHLSEKSTAGEEHDHGGAKIDKKKKLPGGGKVFGPDTRGEGKGPFCSKRSTWFSKQGKRGNRLAGGKASTRREKTVRLSRERPSPAIKKGKKKYPERGKKKPLRLSVARKTGGEGAHRLRKTIPEKKEPGLDGNDEKGKRPSVAMARGEEKSRSSR